MAARKKVQAEEESLPGNPKTKFVRKLKASMEEKLGHKDAKATLGDYIKLVQLEKDMEVDEPRDIKVGWVDRLEKDGEK